MDFIKSAKETIRFESEALHTLERSIDGRFQQSVEAIEMCKGRIVVTGVGKSALVGQKMVATLNSTGTRALFMHGADAVHGDLGMIGMDDLVICISKSGETSELRVLLPILKSAGRVVIAMTSELDSYIAQHAHHILYTPVSMEADPNNLAPTSSSTVQIAMGDAVAMALLQEKGFQAEDFARYHPGGSLGKKLYLRVADMKPGDHSPRVMLNSPMRDILLEMSKSRVGATVVLEGGELRGMITDGDIRRWYEKGGDGSAVAGQLMSDSPCVIEENEMAAKAYEMMRERSISQIVVVREKVYVGMVHIHELLREGFL